MSDMVKSPSHYASILGEKLGIEVIDVSNALGLNGNRFSMLKYLCRAGLKDPAKEVEDLEKIKQYATFEIRRLKGEAISDTKRNGDTSEGCRYYVQHMESQRLFGPFNTSQEANDFYVARAAENCENTIHYRILIGSALMIASINN